MSVLENIDWTKAIESKLDRSMWVKWKFSDLVENIVEKVIPRESGLEHYIGLEHLDSGSLKIRRFGATESLIGDKLKIYKGDLIFAKRNAYLKRVAIADIDAVASAHSLVLRPKPENVLPEFLPFFMLSEKFWQRAIEISVGSLSPTINWKVLAKQEFLLPPIEEQIKIAELLWSMDEVIEADIACGNSLSGLKQSQLNEVFNREKCIKVKVGEISDNLDNKRKPISKNKRIAGKTPYYGASGIVDYVEGFTHNEPILLISEDGENLNSRKLPIAYSVDGESWINNHAHVLRVTKASRYLVKEYFNFTDISDFITGGTRPKVTKGMLTDMPIYIPMDDLLEECELKLLKIDKAIYANHAKMTQSRQLQNSIINNIF